MFEALLELPGNTDKLRSAAAAHQAMSEALRTMATKVGGTDTSDLTGSSADAARRRLQDVVAAVDSHAQSLADLGTKMTADADEMEAQKQSFIRKLEGIAAGIAAATVVGVAMTWVTFGLSDYLATTIGAALATEALAASTAFTVLVEGLALAIAALPSAILQAFVFKLTDEAVGPDTVWGKGTAQELKEIASIALGIEIGMVTGGGLVKSELLGAWWAGAAGGAATGLWNTTLGTLMVDNEIDPNAVWEAILFAGLGGAIGGKLLTKLPRAPWSPASAANPAAGAAPVAELPAPALPDPVPLPVEPAPAGGVVELQPPPAEGIGPALEPGAEGVPPLADLPAYLVPDAEGVPPVADLPAELVPLTQSAPPSVTPPLYSISSQDLSGYATA